MADELRAAVIIDYQNVHLTGAGLFEPYRPKHECLIHPLHYANQLIQARNKTQRGGRPLARLERVLVYRGLPSPEHDPKPYARNLAQKTEWERDPRVKVTLRPLKYRYERTKDGRKTTDATGRPTIIERLEKGVDVLCALALIREARDPNIDLVILASQDTDLEPALDEALSLGTAKVETASWYDNVDRRASKEIRPRKPARIWNTRLNAQAFMTCQDRKDYAQLGQSGLDWAGLPPRGPRDARSSEWPTAELGSRESPSRTGHVAALRQLGSRAFGLFADLVGVEVPAAPGACLVTWPPPDQPPFLPAAWLGGSRAAIPPCRSQCCSCLVAASRVLYIGEAIGGSTGRRGFRSG